MDQKRLAHRGSKKLKDNAATNSIRGLSYYSIDAMNEPDRIPGWIELLYARRSPAHALHTGYLLDSTNEWIAEAADAHSNGRNELRQVAQRKLASSDSNIVAMSLLCLGVVGQHDDLAIIEKFLQHPSDLVNRAARACNFQLQRMAPLGKDDE